MNILLYTDTKKGFFFQKGQYLLKIMQRRFLQCEPVDIHGTFYEKIR